ncbi:hypothetical protein ACS0TY_017530 [Phlomoides rotata]
MNGRRYYVDLKNMSCSCREWDLSGIPCCHGLSAIGAEKLDMEDFVYSCYTIETYNKVYISTLQPMVGVDMWEKIGYIPPLPPNFGKKKKGRQAIKSKKKGDHNERTCEWKKFAEEFPDVIYHFGVLKTQCFYRKPHQRRSKTAKMLKILH